MNRLILALPLALAACAPAAPPVIVAYDVPYMSGKTPGDARPMPRPAVEGQRRWPGCEDMPLGDCATSTPLGYFEDENGNIVGPFNEIVDIPAPDAAPGPRPDVPPFDFTPTLPAPEPAPVPEPEPEIEPTPEPEPEQPAKVEGPA